MLKKLFLLIITFFFCISGANALDISINKGSNSSSCRYSEGASISSFLNGCKPSNAVGGVNDMKVEGGFKTVINKWIKNISLVLGLLAVGCLVYAGLLMQLSAGEDDQIKKGKNIVKWTIFGFILLISASGIVYIIVNIMFGLG